MVCRVVLLLGMLVMPVALLAQDGVEGARSTESAVTRVAVKLNMAYAALGVVNPQVEFRIAQASSVQSEVVYSPWKSFAGHPLHFAMFINEYRYYVPRAKGLYVGANGGMMAFNMSKPMVVNGRITFQERYCKGYGFMAVVEVGYEWQFVRHPRWVMDIFLGFGYMHSNYNGYSMEGVVDMYPHRPEDKQPLYPDPFNSSAEWMPTKIGVSLGVAIFD